MDGFSCGCHHNHASKEQHDRFWQKYAERRRLRNHPELRPPKKPSKAQRRKNRQMGLTADGKPKGHERRNKRPDYHAYIQSKAWRARRKQYYDNHGQQCEVCGSCDNVQLHHLHYRTLGRERDQDLKALCRGCHENEHEQDGKTADPMTREFLSLHL